MAKANLSSDKVLADGARIATVWEANPDFRLGAVTLAEFNAAATALQQVVAQVEALRTQLTGVTNARDDQASALSELVTRARSGFRAVYGPDSSQYEQAGGTRKSERKSPTRKKAG